eukprot:TRINITY_DN63526_c0_g1_i1.p1 TRINITY_DN63526_c0_g1~~TRINITY_DN63526_c0_g1_i1.p1  ORF type:complete len:636 (+),score=171.18 TRINITY_DN63526_c0_g1_i1:54-1910(+)
MAPRGSAAAMLKEALVRQFGTSSREVVEAEVEGRLAASGGRLDRGDLDAIERSVMAYSRDRRGMMPRRMQRQRSSPEAFGGYSGKGSPPGHGVNSHGPFAGAGAMIASASSTAPARPRGCGTASSSAGSASGGSFRLQSSNGGSQRGVTGGYAPASSYGGSQRGGSGGGGAFVVPAQRPTRSQSDTKFYRPYGLAITQDDDASSERSTVVVRPKFPVPLPPKLKPMDHWDLIVAFDAEKHRQEEEAFLATGKKANHAKFRATLDGQMDEMRATRAREAAQKQQDRDDMLAQMEENTRLEAKEAEVKENKRVIMQKANDDMTGFIQERKAKTDAKKQKEQNDVLRWMDNEKARVERERQEKAVEYAQKCKTAREELDLARDLAAKIKREEKEEEKKLVFQAQEASDANEASKNKAIADRMEKMEELSRVFGAAIAKRDAEESAALEAQIKKVTEEGERIAKEDAERRRTEHEQKVREMLVARAKQVKEREVFTAQEKVENVNQMKIWKKQAMEANQKELDACEKRRKARAELDEALIEQIRGNVVVHPHQFGMTEQIQKRELALNRVLFEHMASENFHEKVLTGFLDKAKDRGAKTDPYPSVGHYEGPIHPLEIKENDV